MPDLLHKVASFWGPEVRVAYCKFTTANTAAPTVLESKGVTAVTRSAAGRFNIDTVSPCKSQMVLISQAGTTAQIAIERLAGNVPTTGDVDVSVVTAGGSTEADTTGLTVTVIIIQRMNG